MQRKLIKQGKGDSLTVYLPKQWIDSQGLQAGDVIEIEDKESYLELATTKRRKTKEIRLRIKQEQESAVRAPVVNAYRAGFTRIYLQYTGQRTHVEEIVDRFLLGFEISEQKENRYVIESMSEPSYEQFDKLFLQQFHRISQLLEDLPGDVKRYVHLVQRYDNFLKRCLVLGTYNNVGKPFIWHLLSQLVHIARLCLHFSNYMKTASIDLHEKEMKLLVQARKQFSVLKESYMKKDIVVLGKLHEREKYIRESQEELFVGTRPEVTHQLLQISKLIYLANSALTGMLEIEFMQD